MTISDETVCNILESWPVGVLSTYGRDRIHSVPIVFVTMGRDIFSPIDGKPKSGRMLQRVADLLGDQRFTLLLQNYDEDWQALWWLRLSGHGKVVAVQDLDVPLCDAIVTSLRAKYVQYEGTAVLADPGQVLRLSVRRTAAWACAGDDWLRQSFAKTAGRG